MDESREQTKAIHDLQREAETFDGLRRKVERERILAVHRNAQRLLKPLHVVNPFAKQLTFLSDRTRTRRDHVKYLTLIRSIALLHQHQRPLKEQSGLEYIEVERGDIEAANALAHEVLGRSLDELAPQTRRLLGLLKAMVDTRCKAAEMEQEDCLFTRREVREFTGWSQTQVKVHLDRLEELEYILSARGCGSGLRGVTCLYELLFDGQVDEERSRLVGLLDPEKLNYDSKLSGLNGKLSGQKAKLSPPNRPQNGGLSFSSVAAERTGGKASSVKRSRKGKNAQEPRKPESIVT